MEEQEKLDKRADIFSQVVRAGKRTYFFDVKATRAGDNFLTITESKKKFAPNGTVTYKKHKIYLYKEDFEKFGTALKETLAFIENQNHELGEATEFSDTLIGAVPSIDFEFEDLESDSNE
ncbi:MAG: DUF3276 family protein [Bacteroidales bacterium]